jgi:cystathionine gamma-synthase
MTFENRIVPQPASGCTRAVRAGIDCDTAHGAVTPPLHLSSNFTFAGFNGKRAYDYTRSGNPTRDLLAEALRDLEGGAGAVVTASGMAAVALVLELVPHGATVLAAHDCYGGTWRLLDAWAKKDRFKVHFADLTNPLTLAAALDEQPALVWVETPSNPLLRITDIRHVAQAAHAAGALCVVDNTFLSPELQQPLRLGADIAVHSTTKYINGHSDVVGGAVIAKDPAVAEQLKWWGNCLG